MEIALDTSNYINIVILFVTAAAAYLNYYFIKRQQWVTLYFEINRRYAEIRRSLPDDINYDDFDVKRLKDPNLMCLMRQYFTLCSEEFYLKEKKKWIERELWNEWDSAIRFYMKKKAFREAWKLARNDIYYTKFNNYMENIIIKNS